jgi:outer membrane receptor protein involved in Fe transport
MALAAGCVVLAGLWPTGARAEEADFSATPSRVEEILVTATKRTTALQMTPLAISALTGEQLDTIGAEDFQDYFRKVPGLAVVDAGAGRKRYLLRGVSSIAGMQSQATVAQYLDEIPLTDNFDQQPDPHLIDIERVEVLRGPQGTLFGARAVSGTIRTITRKPRMDRVEGNANVTVSNTRFGGMNEDVEGTINLPVNESFAVRASAFYDYNDGYIDNIYPGGVIAFSPQQLPPGLPLPPPVTIAPISEKNFSDVRFFGGRGAVRWQPSDRLTVDMMILGQKGKIGGIPFYDVAKTGNESAGLVTSVLTGSGNDDTLLLGSGTLAYNFDWAELTANLSYAKRDNFAANAATLVGPGPVGTSSFGANTKALTFESRLASKSLGRWQWLIGAYVFDQDRDARNVMAIGLGSFTIQDIIGASHTNEYAGFGELSYKPIETVTLTAGLRYSEYRNHLHQVFFITPPGATHTPDLRFNEDSTTLKFEISYAPTQDFMTYVLASQGFRPGGFNPNAVAGFNTVPLSFNSDSLWNYEAGAKSAWFDHRLTLNGAVYMIDWTNMQVQGFTPAPVAAAPPIAYTTNGSTSQIVGLELEGAAQITQRISLDFSFNHFFKNSLTKDPPPNPTGLAAKAGDPLSFNPVTSFNIGAEYRAPLTDKMDGFARLDWSYTGRRYTGFRPLLVNGQPNALYNNLPPYHLVNARIGVNQDQWRVTLYVENIFDARPIMQQQNLTGPPPSIQRVTSRPRTVGATVSRNF